MANPLTRSPKPVARNRVSDRAAARRLLTFARPVSDSLYGMQPDPAENFGVNLGAIAPRGERNTLIVSLDALLECPPTPSSLI